MKDHNCSEGKMIQTQQIDRRDRERKHLTSGIKATFNLEFQGEILDISPDGISFKFHPIGSHSLNIGTNLRIHLDMNDQIISLHGEVRRVSEKFGHLVIGLKYNKDEIARFKLPNYHKDNES